MNSYAHFQIEKPSRACIPVQVYPECDRCFDALHTGRFCPLQVPVIIQLTRAVMKTFPMTHCGREDTGHMSV